MIRSGKYIHILNELEYVRYNVEESKLEVNYSLPDSKDFKYILHDDINDSVKIEPLFSNGESYPELTFYNYLIFINNKEDISQVYKIKNSRLFYTGESICAVFRNRIEVYKVCKFYLVYVKRLKTIKDKIDDIIEKDGVFYFVSGNKLIKNDIINLVVDTDYKMDI